MQNLELEKWVKGKKKEDLTLDVFCKVRFANKVLFIEKLLWYSTLRWYDFTAAWLLTLLRRLCNRSCLLMHLGKQTIIKPFTVLDKFSTPKTVRWHCSWPLFLDPCSSFTVVAMVQWKCGLCVASSSVCYYVFTMLLWRGLTDLIDCLSLYA